MTRTIFTILCLLGLSSGMLYPQEGPQATPEAASAPRLEQNAPKNAPAFRGRKHFGDELFPEARPFFETLKKTNPEEYDRLMKLRQEDRKQFMREISRMLPRPHQEHDQKFFVLDKECWAIALELRDCKDATRQAELTAKLEAKITEMLDLLVEQTQRRLEETSKRLQTIQQNRDKILKQKMKFFLHAPPPPQNH